MTVVAYKNGILAADSFVQCSGTIKGSGDKIIRTKDGILLGAAGDFAAMTMFFNWFQDKDEDKPLLTQLKLDNFEGLIISKDGEVLQLDPIGYPMELEAPFHAIGSGAEMALAAMEVGASAEEAVRATIKWSTSCGGDIKVLKL